MDETFDWESVVEDILAAYPHGADFDPVEVWDHLDCCGDGLLAFIINEVDSVWTDGKDVVLEALLRAENELSETRIRLAEIWGVEL